MNNIKMNLGKIDSQDINCSEQCLGLTQLWTWTVTVINIWAQQQRNKQTAV